MVGVSGVSSAVEREGRAPMPCLWALCAGVTAAWIGEPFVVGVDGVSFGVGWERQRLYCLLVRGNGKLTHHATSICGDSNPSCGVVKRKWFVLLLLLSGNIHPQPRPRVDSA